MPASPPGKLSQLALALQVLASMGRHGAWLGIRSCLSATLHCVHKAQALNQPPDNPVQEQPGEGASQACPCLELVVRQENSLGDRPDGERQTLEPGQPVAAGPAVL